MEPPRNSYIEPGLDDEPTVDPTERDRQTLEREGDRPDADGTRVRHMLGVPTREAAEALAAIVLNEAHDAQIQGPTGDAVRPWHVIATSHGPVSEALAAAAERRFTELAAEHGGRYDGWEAV